jgi:hypothetical protein
VRKLIVSGSGNRDLAIIPELRLSEHGVKVTPPSSRFELLLTGQVDYALVNYEMVEDNWGESEYQNCNVHTACNPTWVLVVMC